MDIQNFLSLGSYEIVDDEPNVDINQSHAYALPLTPRIHFITQLHCFGCETCQLSVCEHIALGRVMIPYSHQH